MTVLSFDIPKQPPADDPYRYGWRYVRRDLPEGGYSHEQLPLTLEDVLYPEVGDFVVHNKAHEDRCVYFTDVFNAQLRHDPTAVVLHDVRIAWDLPEMRPNGPDIAVIFGVRAQQNWSTFDIAEEGVRPTLIIEVTSPETRSIDLVDKLDIYSEGGATWYIIVDARRRRRVETLHLLGYVLTTTGYEMMARNERGWLWLEPVNVWIGIEGDKVLCYDEQGNAIGNYATIDAAFTEANAARAAAEQRTAAAEAARAEAEAVRQQAEQRIRELEDLLRRASEAA